MTAILKLTVPLQFSTRSLDRLHLENQEGLYNFYIIAFLQYLFPHSFPHFHGPSTVPAALRIPLKKLNYLKYII